MRIVRRSSACLLVFGLFGLLSCTEESPVAPEADVEVIGDRSSINFADGGALTESRGFAFLSPLTRLFRERAYGTLDRSRAPSLRICSIGTEPGPDAECVTDPVELFAPGEAKIGKLSYYWAWDTDGPNTPDLQSDEFYRLEVLVGSTVLGTLDLDPYRGWFDDRDEDVPNYRPYAFRIGWTIPVRVFIGEDAGCIATGFVNACDTGTFLDEDGGSIEIEDNGVRIRLDVPAGAIPPEYPEVQVVLESLDPDAYFDATGEECLLDWDAPVFGPCVRITTEPELPDNVLLQPALLSICVDTSGFGLTPAQAGGLTTIRYDDGVYEALAAAEGECESGVVLAGLRSDDLEELETTNDRPIRLGALSSSFSNFQISLLGLMVVPSEDVVLETGAGEGLAEVTSSVLVVDYQGSPVEGATVRYSTDDGSVAPADVITGADGIATTTWTVDTSTPGIRSLTASALGLFDQALPDETVNQIVTPESVVLQVAVQDPPEEGPIVTPGSVLQGSGEAAVRFKGDNSGAEIFLGVSDLGQGTNRIEAEYPTTASSWQDGNYAVTFAFDATANAVTTSIDGPGGTRSLTYDFDEQPGELFCATSGWDTANIKVLDRLDPSDIAFNDVTLNGFALGSFAGDGSNTDAPGPDWTVSGFDFSGSWTMTGTLVVSGGWPSNETSRLEISVGCEVIPG